MDLRIERDQEFSLFLKFMDQIQFSGTIDTFFFHQERFMKLFDPEFKISYFHVMIEGLVLLVVAVLISFISNFLFGS